MNLCRPTLALAALIIGSYGALAAESDADKTWISDQSGCKLVEPERARGVVLKPIWDGECVDGFLSGPGMLKMGPVTYTGEFKNGQMLTGEMTMGDVSFKGEFKDNMPGRGVLKNPGATITAVVDKDGNFIGPAVAKYSDGSHYEGDLDKTRGMHGKGRHTKADGDYYEGEFQQTIAGTELANGYRPRAGRTRASTRSATETDEGSKFSRMARATKVSTKQVSVQGRDD